MLWVILEVVERGRNKIGVAEKVIDDGWWCPSGKDHCSSFPGVLIGNKKMSG